MVTKLKPTTSFSSMPTLSHSAMVQAIRCTGHEHSLIVQGGMGGAKTAMLKEISELTGMRPVLLDCTTKADVGDCLMPNFYKDKDGQITAFDMVPNVEFGMHMNEDIVLCVDEVGKNRALMPALTRLFQERIFGSRKLSDRSILFGCTNLAAENVGDVLSPLLRNRVTVVRKLSPTNEEWMRWAIQNNIHPILISAAHEFPEFFTSFTDYENFQDNEYIYDPRDPSRTAYVTCRSLAGCNSYVSNRMSLGDESVLQLVAGTIGFSAAHKIITFMSLDDALPQYEEIVNRPKETKVPESAGAKIMIALKLMQRVEQEDYSQVHTYMERLPMEMQGLFFNQIIKLKTKRQWVEKQPKFTEFVRKNFALFTS